VTVVGFVCDGLDQAVLLLNCKGDFILHVLHLLTATGIYKALLGPKLPGLGYGNATNKYTNQ
jgi:hypothetical protein